MQNYSNDKRGSETEPGNSASEEPSGELRNFFHVRDSLTQEGFELKAQAEVTQLVRQIITKHLEESEHTKEEIEVILDEFQSHICGFEIDNPEHAKVIEDMRARFSPVFDNGETWSEMMAARLSRYDQFIEEGVEKGWSFNEVSRREFADKLGAPADMSWKALIALSRQQGDQMLREILPKDHPKEDYVVFRIILPDSNEPRHKELSVNLISAIKDLNTALGGKVFFVEDVVIHQPKTGDGMAMREIKIGTDVADELKEQIRKGLEDHGFGEPEF